MSARGGRGWAGEKSNRFMMVGTKDSLPAGAKTGVVAPVPINTPSLRQEIHGSQGDSTGIASISRSNVGGGWGTVAAGIASAAGNTHDQAGTSGTARARGTGGGRSQGGDDVFTRHFPDLRAGLQEAERQEAMMKKVSGKVAPLRKPKPEPAKDQGPSLRPRAMLKPTGSAGGGSAATAAAQAAIKDAVHNRVAVKPKPEEPRKNGPSFADEISATARWPGRSSTQESGSKGRQEGTRGGRGRAGGGRGAWDRGGNGGRGYDTERGPRDVVQDKDRRSAGWGSDRNAGGGRGRESIYGSGSHGATGNSDHDASAESKTLTTTYVRQHGPPPRKASTLAASAAVKPPADTQEQKYTAATHQQASKASYQAEVDQWNSTETSKWRTASSLGDEPAGIPEPSSAPDTSSLQPGSYVRTHGPPRRGGRDGQGDDQSSTAPPSRPEADQAVGREREAAGETATRFGSAWGGTEHGRFAVDRDSLGSGERTLSGRWKEPAASLAPRPAPTNTRWKEPKEEAIASRTGMRRWRSGGREESQGSGRWSREVGDARDGDSNAGPGAVSSPPERGSWKDSASVGWGLQRGEEQGDVNLSTVSPKEQAEPQHDIEKVMPEATSVDVAASPAESVAVLDSNVEANAPSAMTVDQATSTEQASYPGSFAPKQTSAPQPVLRTASWEPQLPRGGDTWSAAGHGRDAQSDTQRPSQAGPPGSGASQPWTDPWGTSTFDLTPPGEQGSTSITSFLGNNDAGEPRKDRYLPPALRNRTPNDGNQPDPSSMTAGEQETDKSGTTLPQEESSNRVSNQELIITSAGPRMVAANAVGASTAKPALYDQQPVPLEEWQQSGAQTSHRPQDDQSTRSIEHQMHQKQSQHLHLHDQSERFGQEYRPAPPTSFSSFQPQDRHEHQMQEPMVRQFQPDHFRAPNYHTQEQGTHPSVPEHLQHHQYQQDHVQRQHYNQVQLHQTQAPQQMHMPQHSLQQHSLHQAQQPAQHMHPHQQAQQQMAPPPVGNQMGQMHHSRQHQRQQQGQAHHHQQDIGRQISQPHQIHVHHQQQQQLQQHPPFMGYGDPRGRGTSGLGGLPVHSMTSGSFRDVPQHQPGIPPPGPYGFQSPETRHKR